MKIREIITHDADLMELGVLDALKGIGKFAYRSAGKGASKSTNVASAVATGGKSAMSIAKSIGPIGTILMQTIGGVLLKNYYDEYTNLKNQKEKYDSGDRNTDIFGNAKETDANAIYEKKLDTIIGETIITAIPMTKAGNVLWKIVGLFGKTTSAVGGIAGTAVGGIAGGIPGAVIGGLTGSIAGGTGKLIGLSAGAMGGISKLLSGGATGAVFMAFLASPASQDFLKNALQGMLLEAIGAVGKESYNRAAAAMESFMKWYNTDSTGTSNQATPSSTGTSNQATPSSTGTSNQATPSSTDSKQSNSLPPELKKIEDEYSNLPLKIRYDSDNPKIIFVNDVPVTDADGFQTASDSWMKDIDEKAKTIYKPNPLLGIPKKPGKNYDFA